MILRPEARGIALVAKDDVRVQVCVKIADAKRLDGILERSLALTGRIVGAVASRVVGAVAVNVHVVVAAVALKEDGVGQVAAVDLAGAEGVGKSILTSAGLSKEY